jgi:hypothetical protein
VLSLHVLSLGHAVLYATIQHCILLRLLYVPIVDICQNGAFTCIVLPLLLVLFIVTLLLLLQIAFLLIYVNDVPFVYDCCCVSVTFVYVDARQQFLSNPSPLCCRCGEFTFSPRSRSRLLTLPLAYMFLLFLVYCCCSASLRVP